MNVGQLRAVLLATEQMYRELGDEAAANGVACFSNLLKQKKSEKISEFVRRIKESRKLIEAKPLANSRRGSPVR
jgi:hypothetical protein